MPSVQEFPAKQQPDMTVKETTEERTDADNASRSAKRTTEETADRATEKTVERSEKPPEPKRSSSNYRSRNTGNDRRHNGRTQYRFNSPPVPDAYSPAVPAPLERSTATIVTETPPTTTTLPAEETTKAYCGAEAENVQPTNYDTAEAALKTTQNETAVAVAEGATAEYQVKARNDAELSSAKDDHQQTTEYREQTKEAKIQTITERLKRLESEVEQHRKTTEALLICQQAFRRIKPNGRWRRSGYRAQAYDRARPKQTHQSTYQHHHEPRQTIRRQQNFQRYGYYPTIGLFTTSDHNEERYIRTNLLVAKREYSAILDTGADVSTCTPIMARNPAFREFGWPTPELLLPDGSTIPASGAVQGIVRDGKAEFTTVFVVTPPSLPEAAILGGVTLIAMHDMLGSARLKYSQDKGFSIRYDHEANGKITESLGKQKETTKDIESSHFEAPNYVALDIATYPARTYIAGRIRGTKAVGRWDTGAPRSLCRATTAFKYGVEKISAEAPAIHFLNSRPVPSIGTARIHFEAAHLTSTIEAIIVPDAEYKGNEDILLGLDWTAAAVKRCNFIFNVSRKELFLDGVDIAIKKDGQAKIYNRGHDSTTTSIHHKHATNPTQKRTRSYVDLNRSTKRKELAPEDIHNRKDKLRSESHEKRRNAEHLDEEAKRLEELATADDTQLLTEATNVNKQLSQYMQAAYQVGAWLVGERDQERNEKEEWKNRTIQAENDATYWSQAYTELSAKVREEQRKQLNTNTKNSLGENEQVRQLHAGIARIDAHNLGNRRETPKDALNT